MKRIKPYTALVYGFNFYFSPILMNKISLKILLDAYNFAGV